jgi:DNA-directed RNA polymerase specialized sigma24 family protein
MDSAERAYQQAPEEFRAELLHWVPNVSRFARMLTRNADDADDLAQETILKACANWTSFRAGTNYRRWLFAICRNQFLRDQQRSTRIVAVDDPETDVRKFQRGEPRLDFALADVRQLDEEKNHGEENEDEEKREVRHLHRFRAVRAGPDEVLKDQITADERAKGGAE